MKIPFAKHTWLGFIRSPTLTKKLFEAAIIGFFGLYMAVSLIGIGIAAPELISKFAPHTNPVQLVAGFICAFAVIDILVRYLMQKFPAMSIKPYLLLPVRRSRIVNFMLFKALLSPFNLVIPFFLTSFLFKEVLPNHGGIASAGLVLLSLCAILVSNYLAYALTAFAGANKKWAYVALAAIAVVIYLEVNGIIHLLPYLIKSGGILIANPMLLLIPIAIATSTIIWLRNSFIKEISYGLNANSSSPRTFVSVDGLFSRFGKPGIIMDMEVRLIMRSRRARSFALISLAYCLMPFLLSGKTPPTVMLAFFAFLIIGGFAMNYGQLMLSWNSMHFDLLLSRGYKIKDIFTAKFYLLAITCTITFFITLPFVFVFSLFPLIALSMTLWSASFSVFAYMLLASVNSERIDPNEGAFMNHSGMGISHYLIVLPLMAVPFAFYGLGWLIAGTSGALLVLGGMGILGLALHKRLINLCVSVFKKNRYKISRAFRTR